MNRSRISPTVLLDRLRLAVEGRWLADQVEGWVDSLDDDELAALGDDRARIRDGFAPHLHGALEEWLVVVAHGLGAHRASTLAGLDLDEDGIETVRAAAWVEERKNALLREVLVPRFEVAHRQLVDDRALALAAERASAIGLDVLVADLDTDGPAREAAVDALALAGALDPLRAVISSGSVTAATAAMLALRRMPAATAARAVPELRAALHHEDAEVRGFAAGTLGCLGAEGAEAVPDLVALLERAEPEDQTAAIEGLVWLGQAVGGLEGPVRTQVGEALRLALHHPGDEVRCDVCRGFWATPPVVPDDPRALADALAPLTRDPSKGLRFHATRAYARWVPPGPEAVVLLMERLGDRSSSVVFVAAEGLERLGPHAAPAVSLLAKRVAHRDPMVRSYAARALGAVGPAAVGAVGALQKALADPDGDVRAGAAGALGAVGPGAAGAADALLEALSDPSWLVRCRAIDALLALGVRSPALFERLRALARDDPEDIVRRSAAEASS